MHLRVCLGRSADVPGPCRIRALSNETSDAASAASAASAAVAAVAAASQVSVLGRAKDTGGTRVSRWLERPEGIACMFFVLHRQPRLHDRVPTPAVYLNVRRINRRVHARGRHGRRLERVPADNRDRRQQNDEKHGEDHQQREHHPTHLLSYIRTRPLLRTTQPLSRKCSCSLS